MKNRRLFLMLGALLPTTWATSVLAAPPGISATDAHCSGIGLLLVLLLGMPALVFSLLAPSPLPLSAMRKLLPLRFMTALLSVVLMLSLAWKERAAVLNRVRETWRRNVLWDGRGGAWRELAKRRGDLFHRAEAAAGVMAMLITAGMWTWTVLDENVSWGEGFEVPFTFATDTLLTFLASAWLCRRVALHVALGLLENGALAQANAMIFRGVLLGGAAGWLGGALFGLSSGVQTYLLIPWATSTVVPLLTGIYGVRMFLWGMGVGLALVAVMAWPRARQHAVVL